MSEPNTLANGIKVAFLYGIAGPEEEPDLYQRIHAYVFKHKLVPEDFVGREPSFYLLRQFFRKIEELTGFKDLDYEGGTRRPGRMRPSLSWLGGVRRRTRRRSRRSSVPSRLLRGNWS